MESEPRDPDDSQGSRGPRVLPPPSSAGSWFRSDLNQKIKANAWSGYGMAVASQLREDLPELQAELAAANLRDAYDLGFLGLEPPVREKEIEADMVSRIRDVLLEFGHDFAFMGNQYSVSVGCVAWYWRASATDEPLVLAMR